MAARIAEIAGQIRVETMLHFILNFIGSIYCMDCGKHIGSTDGEDSSGLCDACYRKRCDNGGDS